MDRFIEKRSDCLNGLNRHLKSNMDRFIAAPSNTVRAVVTDLKSNMDRFIALLPPSEAISPRKFKIQYG